MTRRLTGLLFCLASCSATTGDTVTSGVTLVAEQRIGSETSGPEYQFTALNFVVAHGNNVFVAQRHPPEIRVFGSDGVFRHAIGRQGSGPGEFQSIWSMGIAGDSLWTIDIDLRRLTFFTPNGSVISTVPFDPVPPTLGRGLLFLAYQDVLLPGGDFLGFGRGAGVSKARGDITANPLLRMGPDGRAVDTLAWVSIKNDDMILKSSRGTMYRPQPFSDAALTVYAPDIRRAYVIERWAAVDAKSASMQVTAIDATGDTAWTREIPYTAVPLDRELVDDVRRKLEKALASVFPKDEINRALFAPTYRTPITAALVATDGTLWLRWDDGTRAASYSVLSVRGDLTATVSAQARIRLKWVSDTTAWGEELDENDVPTLVQYRISPPLRPR